MYFGAIAQDLAERIENETGLELENYNCTLRASEIRKIFKDHGTDETEIPRGHRAITEEDIVSIPIIIQSPDEIRLSKKLFEGKPVVEFIKTINGRTVVTAYVSAKHLDLTVQTMYSGKNKGNLATAAGDQAPANTPEAHVGTVPNINIRKANPKVNPKSTTDSDGNQLSAGQQKYFADSKERDANGNLRVMYRGDSEEVTVYDRKKSKPSNLYGRGFYYTADKSHAGQYGTVRAFYLNTVDPLMPGQHNIAKEQMLRFLEAIENDGEDYDLYNYGEGATAESVLETVWGKGDFEMLQDVSASAIGDLVAAVELFNEINGTNYDSIRLPTETVIFKSNQAKLTTNKNPTDDPDIRYSIGSKTDGAVQALLEKENESLREDVARLKALLKLQGKQTHGTVFTRSSVEAAARYLKKNAGAKGDTKELTKLLSGFYSYIASGEVTWEDVREQARPIAQWLMDHVEHNRSDYAQEVLDQIKGSRIYLDENQMEEAAYRFESYDAYRKSLMGSVTLAKDADVSLDSWWQEMSTLYPDVFDPAVTAADMPSELAILSLHSFQNSFSCNIDGAFVHGVDPC